MSDLKIEETNLANYGGEDHRNAMKAAAETEKEYIGAGSKPGLEIWRVENRRTENDTPDFGVKRWPKSEYGQFYDGDSYIILNTYKQKDSEALLYDVHFWLGKFSTQDELGVAAYKTVELDDLLNDVPVQHRETMGNESPLFQSYFKDGITYLSGGIESGFRKVKPEEYVPRLFEIRRTNKATRVVQVETNVSSMNKGDCYVLDLGTKVYKYFGPNSSPFEKSKTGNIAFNVVNGREGKSRLCNIEDDEDFWTTLGGTENDLADDKVVENRKADCPLESSQVKIYNIHEDESSGKVSFTAIEKNNEKGYSRDQLDSTDVFIIDSGVQIFIWRGSGSTKQEKNLAWKLVDVYIKENGIYAATPVCVIDEGKLNSVKTAY
eukprot:snap_masked-scaffold_30-processed-gene-2.34-mRNA-1 protein AED:0.08 eAED:0.08 QI:0/0/0/0.5/1/1/2/0/377